MFLTVTCNPALDWMMRLPAFAEGVTNRSAADDLSYGGKGVNVATMLHRFGQDACASGFIAGTTGTARDAWSIPRARPSPRPSPHGPSS